MLNYECLECAWKGKPPKTLVCALLKVQQPWGDFAMTFAHLCLEMLWSGVTNWYDILLVNSRVCGGCLLIWKRFFHLQLFASVLKLLEAVKDFQRRKAAFKIFAWWIRKTNFWRLFWRNELQWKRFSGDDGTKNLKLYSLNVLVDNFQETFCDSATSDFFIANKLQRQCFLKCHPLWL